MKNVLNELSNVYSSIFMGLPTTQKVILIFWSLCVVAFVFAYIRGVVALIQHYISIKKSKPQKF
jgi:hypothetical protein